MYRYCKLESPQILNRQSKLDAITSENKAYCLRKTKKEIEREKRQNKEIVEKIYSIFALKEKPNKLHRILFSRLFFTLQWKIDEMDSKEIVFRNLNISLKQKHVLKNISGVAKSKEVLGVFGPKGKKLRYTRNRDWFFFACHNICKNWG